uniref:Cytochrome P450 n=1 Tax=Peronospora matthiolae TaxID=2874970 RepID=A0AAV1TAA7_9STRA
MTVFLLVYVLPVIAVATAYLIMSVTIGIRSHMVRAWLLHLVAFCQGVHLQWVVDPDVAFQVLKASGDKGDLIETLLSLPAWSPIVSLESVNGAQWQRMRARFMKVTKVLPSMSKLTTIFESRSRDLLESGMVIDARRLTELSVASFYEWVFEREGEHEEVVEACQATWEWRKQLALKGFANHQAKQQMIRWFVDEIRRTPRLYDLFGEKWAQPEYYSLILQPFVISPAINLTDVAVKIKEWTKAAPVTESISPEVIRQCICNAHPFPVVERYFPNGDFELGIAPNTHALIPLDEMAGDAFAAGVDLSFGAGSRICAGRHMAMKAMTGLFTDSCVRSDLFQPGRDHKYSGRHNDGKETVTETMYQLQFALRIVGSAALHRLTRIWKSG